LIVFSASIDSADSAAFSRKKEGGRGRRKEEEGRRKKEEERRKKKEERREKEGGRRKFEKLVIAVRRTLLTYIIEWVRPGRLKNCNINN
jgi:hypothetical protein